MGKVVKNYHVLLALLFIPTFSQAEYLNDFFKTLNTFQAQFTQRNLDENGVEYERSTGQVYLQIPGKFNWHYMSPYVQKIVADGTSIWIYDELLEQVSIDWMEPMKHTPAGILSGYGDIDTYYIKRDLGEKLSLNWVELIPKDKESEYESIRIGFREKLPETMVLFDKLGQTMRIDIKVPVLNQEIDPDKFSPIFAKQIDVIDQRRK